MAVSYDPAWRERSFGPLLEGKPVVDRAIWQAAGGEVDPPGAEPSVAFVGRVRGALSAVASGGRRRAAVTAVVTHGGPIRVTLRLLAGGQLRVVRNHPPVDVVAIANGSILHLVARHYPSGVRWRVAAVNDVAHLGDLVTTRDEG